MPRDLYVTPDPVSLKAAEERAYREQRASSAVLSIQVESADERRRAEFWRAVDARRQPRPRQMRAVA